MEYLAMGIIGLLITVLYMQWLNARAIEDLREAIDDMALRQANIRKGELSKRMERMADNEAAMIKIIPIRRGVMQIRREV